MSEPILSDDGFWKFDEGEWVPTEKQLLSIENGAIPHDAVDGQNVLFDSSKNKRNAFSTFYSNMRPETRLYSFVGVCVSVTFLSLILVLASLPITSNPVLPVTDCSDSKPLQVIRAESVDSSPLMDEENCPHELKIASWNLENFGQSKANNPEELSEIAGKIRNYDIVAVQEIEDKNNG